MSIGGQNVRRIAAHIAGFGAAIEVTAPQEAREELARIGRELVESYPV